MFPLTATEAPSFTLYGDGTVVFRDPMSPAPEPVGGVNRLVPFLTIKLDEEAGRFVPEAVQSNVVRSVNPQQARYIFFQIADPGAFRRFIANLLDPSKGDPGSDFLDLPADMRTLWSEGWAHSYDEYNKRSVKPLTWMNMSSKSLSPPRNRSSKPK